MEPNTSNINENEPITEEIEEIDIDTAEASEAIEDTETAERSYGRPGRGRHGRHGRRPFGPNRPYRFALFADEDGGFVLRSPDLAERVTKIESLDAVGEAMQAAIDERAAEDAAAQEAAEKDAQFSGKFVLRLPRSMHRQLTELAEAEGVSLNQLALSFLAEGMGRAEVTQEFQERRGKHRGPRGGRGPEGRGGRGPEGFGPRGGRGPGGWGPEGRDFEGLGPKGHRPGSCGPWGRGPRHQDARHRGPWGRGWGPRWFEREISNTEPAQDSQEPKSQTFV